MRLSGHGVHRGERHARNRSPGRFRWRQAAGRRSLGITFPPFNDTQRRIYTDGRGHVPEEDRYPLYYGDSIGFWDDGKLVIHTNQLRAGAYTRRNPDHSDQVETVEIWERIDDRTIEARVWVYDPPSLLEPWYTKQTYLRISNDDRRLRIRYWHCGENPNNEIIQTDEGASDFGDFTFD